ncbi:MAG: response regulator [Blastochloris sp.]|nr:response regulator [Blastochloris sp.]
MLCVSRSSSQASSQASMPVPIDAPESVPMPPAASASLAQQHPLRILLAEDSPTSQRVITLYLERLGYRPDVAASGWRCCR